jgi:hypothetical protein
MTVHSGHAAARAVVCLPDGRTANLVFVPGDNRRGSPGTKARVRLPGGKYLSVKVTDLTLHPDERPVHTCDTCGQVKGPFCRRPDATWECRGCCPHPHGKVVW